MHVVSIAGKGPKKQIEAKDSSNLSGPEFLLFKEILTRGEKAKKASPQACNLRAQSSEAPAYNQIVACCGTDVKKFSPFKP